MMSNEIKLEPVSWVMSAENRLFYFFRRLLSRWKSDVRHPSKEMSHLLILILWARGKNLDVEKKL